MVRVAINGYGRIGRVAHRIIIEKHSQDIEVVAINAGSSTDLKGWMYLLKFDSAYGPLKGHSLSVTANASTPLSVNSVKQSQDSGQARMTDGEIASSQAPRNDNVLGKFVIDSKEIPVFSQKDPTLLPWKDLDVDVVIESTGHFLTMEKAKTHITAGAKAVLLSAPAKEEGIPTYVLSVNSANYKGENIVSNASCTTNCIAPVAKIMQETFGVEKAMMTTIHAYTSDQKLQDGGHKDYRRARAAAHNIIPTSTGATKAAAQAVPALQGIFDGLAIRVPVITGSLSDFTFLLKRNTTKEEVISVLKDAANKEEYRNIVEVSEDPLVSSDIIGNPHSAIIDVALTQVVGGNMVKIIAWYDNEFGYANRLVEEVLLIGVPKAL